PITVILGYTELLLEAHEHGTFSQEQREKFLHDIFRMGDSLARLVDDLLNISRIEAGLPVPLVREPCCLADIAQDVIQRYQNHCENHQFVLQSGDVDQVYADVNKLVQILENLISNAVKYSPQGGTVKISINDVDDKVQVIVEDEGVGMSTYQVERIFDKFYRADSSNTSIGGLGIGMSIVKTIIEEHDGNIRVESDQGIGTRVFFTVPKWQEETTDLSA
ncbi:MAG: HAMP domain-containing histidine kinase, partial [Desulfuromonadales bacterium]|nr:HAMP domain-containing histidine kinase [Desulfuromonadales bacterium]